MKKARHQMTPESPLFQTAIQESETAKNSEYGRLRVEPTIYSGRLPETTKAVAQSPDRLTSAPKTRAS